MQNRSKKPLQSPLINHSYAIKDFGRYFLQVLTNFYSFRVNSGLELGSERSKMDSLKVSKFKKEDSLDDFEFFDAEGDLDVDLSKSPIHDAAQKFSSGIGLIISALCTIVEEQGLVVKIPVSAVAATAVGAVTGSLLAGPPGLAIGLFTGAVLAYHHSSPSRPKSPQQQSRTETKSSIRQIFSQMTIQQKKDLMKELLSCLKQPSVRSLILEILKNQGVRDMAMDVLSNFLKKKMGVSLVKSK